MAEAHFFGLWGAVEELEPIAREQALQDTVTSPKTWGRTHTRIARATAIILYLNLFSLPYYYIQDNPPIRRKDLVRVLMATSSKMELRFQGLNFEGSDLSRVRIGNFFGITRRKTT